MRRNGEIWEYVAAYVDDLEIAMRYPKTLVSALTSAPYVCKLKGSGPIKFHLGMECTRDSNGGLCIESKKYLKKMMMGTYERHFFGRPQHTYHFPLEKATTHKKWTPLTASIKRG
jgi:hypothetical protein